MTRAMLDKYLQSATPRAILLYGECEFLINYYSQMILKRLDSKPRSMYFEYNHEVAVNHLSVNSLFGGQNVLFLKLDNFNASDKKSDKKKPKDINKKFITSGEVAELLSILEANQNSYLVIEFYKSSTFSPSEYAKKFKAFASAFKPKGRLKDVVEMRCFEPFFDDKIRILGYRARELGLNMDSHKLQHLLNTQNDDISTAFGELDKFIYYTNITHELINELCYGLGEVKIDDLLNCLFDKEGHLISILQTLNEKGLDNMELLRELHRYFYILFKLYSHSKAHGNMDCQQVLGYKPPPQIFNVWSRRSLKIKTQTYLALFDILNEWRVKQMQGKNDTIITSLIEIQHLL